MNHLTAFKRAVAQTPIDLTRTSLIVAQSLAYPELDIDSYLQRLDDIAEGVRLDGIIDEADSRPIAIQAEELAHYLFSVIGLRGNTEWYEDPRNSFLNEVLTRGWGIPITLSMIYVDIAQRVGLSAKGVGLPGHFIVRVTNDDRNDNNGEHLYIDPFTGSRLSVRDCANLVQNTTGYSGRFKPQWLTPLDEQDVLIRLLSNLRVNYMREEEWTQLSHVIAHLRVIAPNDPTYLRDEALSAFSLKNFYASSQLLEAYLQAAGDTEDAAVMRITLGQLLEQWATLN